MKKSGSVTNKATNAKRGRFTLETLENRSLLNADIYGIADVFYSEEAYIASLDQNTDQTSEYVAESSYLEPLQALSGGYTLYLNFNPALVYSRAGDFWLNQNSVNVPGYDLSMYGWGGQEQESINYILGFVREDYAAYNVTVTATQPSGSDYTTMYVGGTADWYQTNSNIIGIASYDVGNRDASNYGFAFTEELSTYKSYAGSSLLNFSEYVANLISHEAAHTYGANHIDDAKYLMNPYLSTNYRTTGFGQGQISDENSVQDTQTLMGTNIGYKTSGGDDYGDSITNYQTISLSNTTITGILEHNTDTDAFRFTATTNGTFTVDLDTTAYGNLDSTLSIYNSSGSLLASNDDYLGNDDSLVSFSVTQGQSYTIIVGSSNNQTSGTYSLALTAPAGTPDITITDSSGTTTDRNIDFGDIYVGETASHTITISNSGSDTLTISNIATSGDFDYTKTNGTISLAPGSTTTVTVNFNPETAGNADGLVTIYSNDSDSPILSVNIAGVALGISPDIEITQAVRSGAIDLGSTMCDVDGSGYITIKNSGRDVLQISSITVSSGFSVDTDSTTIQPGASKKVYISYSSELAQTLNGELTIVSNDPDESSLTYEITAQIFDSEQPISGGSIIITEADGLDDGSIEIEDLQVGQNNTVHLWNVTNDSDEIVVINTGINTGSVFSIDSTITIAAGETVAVNTIFNATMPYSYSDEISLSLNDELITVPLTVSTNAYAGLGNKTNYSFTDSDGDSVTVSLKNGTGRIYLNDDSSSDISRIVVSETTSNSSLTIKTAKGSYTTLGDLEAQGNLSSINAATTNLAGNINVIGELGKLTLNEISENSQLDFTAPASGSSLQCYNNEGTINLDGILKSLKVTDNLSGNLEVNGSIKTISVTGNIAATISANGNIDTIKANTIEQATVNANGIIKSINANYLTDSDIYAVGSVNTLAVKYDMTDSVLSAGYSPVFGNASADTTIKSVSVKKLFAGSTISAGVSPANDSLIDGTTGSFAGSIGSVKLGSVTFDNNDESFGIIANGQIKSVKVGRENYTYVPQTDDFYVITMD